MLLTCAAAVAVQSAVQAAAAGAETVRFDFESGGMDGWVIVEGTFGEIITDRASFHHSDEPYNKQGGRFLSTLEKEDGSPFDGFTGVVESPVFTLTGPALSMLVGGGGGADTYVALCTLDGAEIAHARGRNGQTMHRITWDLPALVGRKVFPPHRRRQHGRMGPYHLRRLQSGGRCR